jgi:hypothetical protein
MEKSFKPKKLQSNRQGGLERVVYETLVTSPEDAHLRLVEFLKLQDVSADELEFFKQCWSKVVANNEAFGRKNTKISPELFTQELITELTKNQESHKVFQQNRQVLQIINETLENLDFNRQRNHMEMEPIYDAVEKHGQIIQQEVQSIKDLYAMPPTFLARSREEFSTDLAHQHEYQESIDKAKIKWEKLNVKNASRELRFEPVDANRLFHHSYRYGFLSIPLKNKNKKKTQTNNEEDDHDFDHDDVLLDDHNLTRQTNKQMVIIPKYFSVDSVMAVEVFYDDATNQEDAWFHYAQYMDLSVCRYFNPFPKPVNYDYSPDGVTSVIFIYEYPDPIYLRDYLLPTGHLTVSATASTSGHTRGKHACSSYEVSSSAVNLIPREFPNLLRKYPSIIETWATQLAVAIRHLAHLPAAFNPFFAIYHDTLITSDGCLLLSGINFEDYLIGMDDEALLKEIEYYPDSQNDNNERTCNLESFMDRVVVPILSTCLGTSRIIQHHLPSVHSFKMVGSGLNNPQKTFEILKEPEAKPQMNLYPTYYVTNESVMCVEVLCGNIKGARVHRYEDIFGKEKNFDDYLQNEMDLLTKPVPSRTPAQAGATLNEDFLPTEQSIHSLNTEIGSATNEIVGEAGAKQEEDPLMNYLFNGPIDFDQQYDILSVVYTVEDCEKPDYRPEIDCSVEFVTDPNNFDNPVLELNEDYNRETGKFDKNPENQPRKPRLKPRIRLSVKSLYNCTVNCELASFEVNYDNLEKSHRRWGCLRIQFFTPILTPSCEVQDLIYHLEAFYHHEIVTTLLNSSLFVNAYPKSQDDAYSKNQIVQCCGDWGLLKKDVMKLAAKSEFAY